MLWECMQWSSLEINWIFKQILPNKTIRKVWKPVMRICMLTKGIITMINLLENDEVMLKLPCMTPANVIRH